MFKVAFKFGNYYIYHRDTLTNESFEDSSEMLWTVKKPLDPKDQERKHKNKNNQ